MDINRFTEKAAEAVRAAQTLATRYSNQQIEVEHLLLALLEQQGGLVPSILTRAGINILFGPSGSGKTTTLRAIAGLVAPDEGRIAHGAQIYFDSTMHINLPIQRRRVGFVFQDNALFPHLTAAQNVAYGVAARERTTRARALLAQFGVEHLAAHYPRELSGGEQQRVALARALAPAPAVLLLDEPLSAVDVPTRARLLDEIDAAQRTSGI